MPPGDLKAACNSTFNAAEANKYIQKRLQKEEKIWNKPVQPYVTYHSWEHWRQPSRSTQVLATQRCGYPNESQLQKHLNQITLRSSAPKCIKACSSL